MTKKEIIAGLKFTVGMFLFDPDTGETYTEPRNDLDKTTVDACRGAIELLGQEPKPARWIPIDEEPHEDYECSNCEHIISMYIDMAPHLEYKYCPNCGRKMEGTA